MTSTLEAGVKPVSPVVNNLNGNGAAQASGVGLAEVRPGMARSELKRTNVRTFPKSSPTVVVLSSLLNALAAALTEAMGPMAKIVLRDRIKSLGESFERFPHAKIDMLIESVALEILDERMRAQFRRQMFERLQAMGWRLDV